MAKISIFGVLSNIQMLLFTAFTGNCVGKDEFGNAYYQAKPRKGYKQNRRWVMYAAQADASMVPPEWHGWLHHQTNALPCDTGKYRQSWQKPHQANLTGTSGAYFPPGYEGGKRDNATGDYVAWEPPQ